MSLLQLKVESVMVGSEQQEELEAAEHNKKTPSEGVCARVTAWFLHFIQFSAPVLLMEPPEEGGLPPQLI